MPCDYLSSGNVHGNRYLSTGKTHLPQTHDLSTVGGRIRFARSQIRPNGRRELTQGQLAERVGCGHNQVSQWEHNKNVPKEPLLSRLAAGLNETVDWILTGRRDSADVDLRVAFDDLERAVNVVRGLLASRGLLPGEVPGALAD
jgi:DNA-binding transcriptional regulator YiaG